MILASLLAVIVFQQVRIRGLEQHDSKAGPIPVPSAVLSKQTGATEPSAARSPRATRRADDPLEQARKEHTAQIEKQIDEISAPLAQDMASTMFKAVVKPGQSIVTGGYKTPDGRNQFTVLKPQLIRDASGQDSIRIDSKIIDMGAEDIAATGLYSLATNAKNTLQHAEAWEESDVSNTMETLEKSGRCDRMSGPTIRSRKNLKGFRKINFTIISYALAC